MVIKGWAHIDHPLVHCLAIRGLTGLFMKGTETCPSGRVVSILTCSVGSGTGDPSPSTPPHLATDQTISRKKLPSTACLHAVLSVLLQWKRMAHYWGKCEMPHIGRTNSFMQSLTSCCYRCYQVQPTCVVSLVGCLLESLCGLCK